MKVEGFDFYEDDEGISVNVVLDAFVHSDVQVIYLEADSSDEKMIEDINFIFENQNEFFRLSMAEMSSYVEKLYKSKDLSFKLMKIYIFPDIENEFGFVYRWAGDTEHGIGIKFAGLSVKKIGSSEVAFL